MAKEGRIDKAQQRNGDIRNDRWPGNSPYLGVEARGYRYILGFFPRQNGFLLAFTKPLVNQRVSRFMEKLSL
ncbi:hypothetical protein R0137_02315 [Congregibacter brevis]|uniref:Uncharacterized protein n=1 Tax=Congregibacter brevis TaxID=3081201 RepID=A0ABZ0ICZ7_9GAMM|nr:hypothetical protein R0137_02315 [Congregibacter sp. IMCC45268]